MQGSALPLGFQLLVARITDSDGNTTATSIPIVVGNAPAVSITSPTPDEEFFVGDVVGLEASASDAEDGDLSALITWSSNLQGPLGGGAAIGASLVEGTHTITATVSDLSGLQGSDEFVVIIQPTPPGGFGTATIDGIIGATEYDSAVQFDFLVNLPEGGVVPGTFQVMNDLDNLYIAVSYPRLAEDQGGNAISVEFDVDNDRAVSGGDDGLVFNSAVGFSDVIRISNDQNPAICAPANSPCSFRDVTVGGSNDGEADFVNNLATNTFELSHPLDSGDPNDISLGSGDRLRFANLFIRMVTGAPDFNVGDTSIDDFLIISIFDP